MNPCGPDTRDLQVWTGLMAGFTLPEVMDFSSTGTFDQGGPPEWFPPPVTAEPHDKLSCRVLPSADWARVSDIEPFKSHGLPDDPDHWVVLVVERLGQIVGTCSLFTAAHWDCWWIDPEAAGTTRGLVLRQLLREALAQLRKAEVQQVYTGVEDGAGPEVAQLLRRFGFKPAGGQLFLLQIADAPFGAR